MTSPPPPSLLLSGRHLARKTVQSGPARRQRARPGKPSLILAKTRKGKGVSFMENVARWHHGVPNDEEFGRAMAELEAAEGAMA